MKFRLRMDAPGVATFEDEDTVTVPLIALGARQPGRPLMVVVDPADPKKFVIDWAGNTAGPAMTFSTEDGRTANIAGDPAATAMLMSIFQRYGIQPGPVTDLRSNPQARAEVIAALERSGQLPPPGTAPRPLAPMTGLPGGDDPDPGVRLTKLTELRDSGKITAAEFAEHKRRILSDI